MHVTMTALFSLFLAVANLTQAESNSQETPASAESVFPQFLPAYFSSVLDIKNEQLNLTEHTNKDGINRYNYVNNDKNTGLTIESILCDSAKCDSIYNNSAQFLNKQATDNGGRFLHVTPTEFSLEWQAGSVQNSVFVFKLPNSVLSWSYRTGLNQSLALDARFNAIETQVNHKRYDDALALGNVELGRWDSQVRELAQALLKAKHKDEALMILKSLLDTAPFDYEAQLDLAENSNDPAIAKRGAQSAYENAETSDLRERARHLLKAPALKDPVIPALTDREQGLQLILIVLPPCDVNLVKEAAAIYTKITKVPVKIVRLTEDWEWNDPDRVPNQKIIQKAIIQEEGPSINFTGWTLEKYKAELLKTVEKKDALTKFSTQAFVDKLSDRPSQYDVDPYLDTLRKILSPHRSGDKRVMYVGVTENNIYFGDNNFVFSGHNIDKGVGASILSYSVMEAKVSGEQSQSRKRLIDRIAKELVPASLQLLEIPRPADPTDPYSYSNGLDRLSQKSLSLSSSTKEALNRFRTVGNGH